MSKNGQIENAGISQDYRKKKISRNEKKRKGKRGQLPFLREERRKMDFLNY